MKYKVGAYSLIVTAAILYTITLDNGLRPEELIGGDLITHQYAQVQGRPSNAPGYPLYTMGGWLWFRIGNFFLSYFFDPIEILSLYSALWGVASLLILYLILHHLTQHPLIAFLLTAFHGSTYFFWYYSVTTEQYTSAVFQTLIVIWLAFLWDEKAYKLTFLLWLAFACGTMFANMLTTLFILPPLLWFIFSKNSATRRNISQPSFFMKAAILSLLPLLSYGYIFIRGHQHPEWRGQGEWSSTAAWFIQFLTIQQGRDELSHGLTLQNFFTDEFPALMGQELTWIVFGGGLIGLFFLSRRRRIFLLSTLMIYFLFCWGYRAGNWFQVIIPAYPIFTIGFAALLTPLQKRLAAKPIRFSHLLIPLLLLMLVIFRFATNLPRVNQQNRPDDTGLQPAWNILADNPDSPAVVGGVFEERIGLQYLQTVWELTPQISFADVQEMPLPSPNSPMSFYISRQGAALRMELFNLPSIHPQAKGSHLITLSRSPLTELPAQTFPLAISFGDHLSLIGWQPLSESPLPRPPSSENLWQIALYWQSSASLEENYTISVRPLLQGNRIYQGSKPLIQDHQPVWGFYPTQQWQPHEIVRDVYALNLPPVPKPDSFQVVVYLTQEEGFINLGQAIIPHP